MKTFFFWLAAQALFARVLIGMIVAIIVELKVPFTEFSTLFLPATIIILAEAITSAIVVYPLINPNSKRY